MYRKLPLTINNLQLNRYLEQLQPIIDQIPIRHNLVSHFMFLGIVQAYFLTLVIFLRSRLVIAISGYRMYRYVSMLYRTNEIFVTLERFHRISGIAYCTKYLLFYVFLDGAKTLFL